MADLYQNPNVTIVLKVSQDIKNFSFIFSFKANQENIII